MSLVGTTQCIAFQIGFFFHLVTCIQVPTKPFHSFIAHFFIMLDNIPLYNVPHFIYPSTYWRMSCLFPSTRQFSCVCSPSYSTSYSRTVTRLLFSTCLFFPFLYCCHFTLWLCCSNQPSSPAPISIILGHDNNEIQGSCVQNMESSSPNQFTGKCKGQSPDLGWGDSWRPATVWMNRAWRMPLCYILGKSVRPGVLGWQPTVHISLPSV